jgi:hypothetical protein
LDVPVMNQTFVVMGSSSKRAPNRPDFTAHSGV